VVYQDAEEDAPRLLFMPSVVARVVSKPMVAGVETYVSFRSVSKRLSERHNEEEQVRPWAPRGEPNSETANLV
jgi:hypothetical protein